MLSSRSADRDEAQAAQTDYEAVVVGLGPIGLLAGLSASRNCPDKKIAVLADRRDELGIRQQVLWIEEDVLDFIRKSTGSALVDEFIGAGHLRYAGTYNKKFESREKTDGSTFSPIKVEERGVKSYYITTGDLERLIEAALKKQGNVDVIDVDKIDARLLSQWRFAENSKQVPSVAQQERAAKLADFMDIDREKHTITLKQVLKINNQACEPAQTFGFRYLVVADGAKRSVAKALSTGGELTFSATQEPLGKTKHVVATFNLPSTSNVDECEALIDAAEKDPSSLNPVPQDELKEKFNWNYYSRPYSQVYMVGDVIYIGAEIPNEIAADKEKSQQYARALLKDKLPAAYAEQIQDQKFDLLTKWGQKQKMLSLSIFDIELGDLNRTLLPCTEHEPAEQNAFIFFMGDARKNPLYTTGTGVQTGIREVQNFDALLSSINQKKDLRECLEEYHAHARSILDKIVAVQDDWVGKRNKLEIQSEVSKKCVDELVAQKQQVAVCQQCRAQKDAPQAGFFADNSAKLAQGSLNDLAKKLDDVIAKYKLCMTDDDKTNEVNIPVLRSVSQEIKDKSGVILGNQPKDTVLVEAVKKLQALAEKTLAQCDVMAAELEKRLKISPDGEGVRRIAMTAKK